MSAQGTTARRTFLRQAAKALGAGIAIALIPGIGHASPDSQVICCPDSSCPGSCSGSKRKFRCQGTCPTYCTCLTGTSCVTIPC